jgi:hypothetical protein
MPSSLRLPSLAVLVALFGAPSAAQEEVQAPQDSAPPSRIVSMTRELVASMDGSWVLTTRSEIKVLRPSAIESLAQTALNYSQASQQMEVADAFTRKADGRVLKVAPDAVHTQQARSRNTAMLTDTMQKVILFPDVQVGDVVAYTSVLRSQPVLGGHFFFNVLIPTVVGIDEAAVTIRVPKGMTVSTDASGLDVSKSDQDGAIVYGMRYANPNPPPITNQALSEYDRAARFTISSFKDYDALAKIYAEQALPQMAVTDAIRQQADAITQGVSDPYQQARLIYQWIAGRVRYVAVEFGQGRLTPRAAEATMTNAYGDCKDQAALFGALLKAKGIDSYLVIINSGNAYTVSDTATLAPFDHVISYLPRFKMYADVTNGRNTPFGLLPRNEYGKEVVHVADPRGARHRVPVADGKLSTDNYKLNIRMSEAGHIEVESSSTASGDFAGPVRLLGSMMQGENGRKFAAMVLAKANQPSAIGAFMAPPPSMDDADYRISATWALPEPLAPLAAGASFRLADNLQLLKPVSAAFFGPVLDARFRGNDPAPCYSGRSVDEETMSFPATRRLERLPEDVTIRTAHISFTSRWSKTDTSVSVRREFEARFDTALCGGAVRREVLAAFDRIQADVNASLALPRN